MFDIQNLLQRKTVRDFLPREIDNEILENAILVAEKTPTSLNSKPVILLDISKRKNEDWIAMQPAAQNSPHLFLLAGNAELGEMNARKMLAERYESETDDEKVNVIISKVIVSPAAWVSQQVCLVAGYFVATLEASGVSGCFIGGFDKKIATENLKLPEGYKAELIFACGYEDVEKTSPHAVARKLEEFYYPEA
jgi:nitroreductase